MQAKPASEQLPNGQREQMRLGRIANRHFMSQTVVNGVDNALAGIDSGSSLLFDEAFGMQLVDDVQDVRVDFSVAADTVADQVVAGFQVFFLDDFH